MPIIAECCRVLLAVTDGLLPLAALVTVVFVRWNSSVVPGWLLARVRVFVVVVTAAALTGVLLVAWCARIIR